MMDDDLWMVAMISVLMQNNKNHACIMNNDNEEGRMHNEY